MAADLTQPRERCEHVDFAFRHALFGDGLHDFLAAATQLGEVKFPLFFAQVAIATWGATADAYVIDGHGTVRQNHFNGHGWEHKPWRRMDGVICDPLGGIAAVARHDGLVEVFVTDLLGTVHRRQRRDPTPSPAWEALPGGGLGPQSSLAATRIDDDHLLLCGVRPDGEIWRVEVGDAGTLSDWVSAPAPPRTMSHLAATPDSAARGRIYAVDDLDDGAAIDIDDIATSAKDDVEIDAPDAPDAPDDDHES